jgi:glucokinase
VLGIYSLHGGSHHPLHKRTYPSADYPGLDVIVGTFLSTTSERVDRACFDVAGPVLDGRAKLTNLPWQRLDERELAERLGLAQVRLLNDLEAIALGITELDSHDLRSLHRRKASPRGAVAVVAPGTGLGEAFLTWDDGRYEPHPSEGGHADFAPGDEREMALLDHLRKRHEHVSCELVCSGVGIPNLYDFLVESGFATEPEAVASRIAAAADRTRAIVEVGMDPDAGSVLCAETLRMFVGILGAEAGNLALKVLATGGIYLAGGLVPAVLELLRSGPFLARLHGKGRLSRVVEAMPVHAVVGNAALVGSAAAGLRLLADPP